MKKIFAIIMAIMLLVSCEDRDYEATITYRVYYPENTVTRTYTMDSTSEPGYILASDRGSNYLILTSSISSFCKQEKLEDTTAPIEVVSLTKRKK